MLFRSRLKVAQLIQIGLSVFLEMVVKVQLDQLVSKALLGQLDQPELLDLAQLARPDLLAQLGLRDQQG